MKSNILCTVNGARQLELIRAALFNHWGIKAYGISIDARDTVFRYQVQTDSHTPKGTQGERFTAWIKGFMTALQAVE